MDKPTSSGETLASLDIQTGYTYSQRVVSLWNRYLSVYIPLKAYIGYEWVNYRGSIPSSSLSVSGISKEKLLWGLSVGLMEELYIGRHLDVIIDTSLGYDFGSGIKAIRPSLSVGLRRSL
ncbi:MAG: conjugal transfer protein TraO [Bacteroidales bacterium]|nr:conjugal transfer protein TraO [Bacteroidales bacterium]